MNVKKRIAVFLAVLMMLATVPIGTIAHAVEGAYTVLVEPNINGGFEYGTWEGVAAVWESVYYNTATGTVRTPAAVDSAKENEIWQPMRLMRASAASVDSISSWYQTITGLSPDGYAAAQDFNGKWGVIDAAGQTVVDFIYDDMTAPSEDGYVVANQFTESPVLLNVKGEVKTSPLPKSPWKAPDSWPDTYTPPTALYTACNDQVIGVMTEDAQWSYFTLSGELAFAGSWAQTSGFHNGCAIITSGDSTMVVNETGKVLFIDTEKKYSISCDDGNIVSAEGLVSVYDHALKRCGYIDLKNNGNIVIPFTYAWGCRAFQSGYAAVAFEESDSAGQLRYGWDLIDITGKRVLNHTVNRVSNMSNTGIFWTRSHDGVINSVCQVDLAAAQIAYTSTQSVDVDGTPTVFQMYALKNAAGNSTNYVKVRDVAQVLQGTSAQFSVGWDGAVNLVPGESYTSNGSEMSTPFSGHRRYTRPTAPTNVNGVQADLDAIVLTDDAGGGYTYYKLRDLGKALGFNVSWSAERGVYIESNQPYSEQ